MADTLRILLVDDQAERRELLKIVLDAAIQGCFVDVVGDSVRLGELLNSADVTAVVVAHPSPWLAGFELVERVRDGFPDRPVILLVDAASEQIASAALRLGVADLVVHDAHAPLRVRDALARILAARGIVERRQTDRRGGPAVAVTVTPSDGRRTPGRVPLTGQDAEALPPTTPGAPAPSPQPRTRSDLTDAPTAVMKALDRKRPRRERTVSIPSAEIPTEVGRPGLRELVERAQVGWFRCDPGGELIDANDALLAVLEAGRGDIRLARLGLTKSRWKEFMSAIRKDGAVTVTGLELRTVTGARRLVSLTLRGSSAGRDQAVVDGLLIDATGLETVRADEESPVIELDERRRSKDREEATVRERDRLLGLSHDLQEPLRTVRIYADLLEEKHAETLNPEARQMLQRSREAAARMEEMVADLVEEATIDTRGETHTSDCEEVLSGVMGNLAAAILDSSAEVSHDSLPIVALPANQMTQLLQNLVGNAIKYRSDASPKVHVSAERGNGEWLFTVKDNGMGIPEEFQPRVFEMFERGTEAESLPGSGIGLAVCRRVVESHGGRIWVESKEGEGSTFQFTVPAAAAEKHA